MIKGIFTAPDYYKNFKCKCGDCRTCCCGGWNVTINLKEYFKLVGLKCSTELRERIDKALSVLPNANNERYACINPSYEGDCMLRREDGLCALQCELGEEDLPSVCRYYPRSPRYFPRKEVCISNSCEKVLEDLISSENEMTFDEKELEFYFDDTEPENRFPLDSSSEMYYAIEKLKKNEKIQDLKNGLILHLNGQFIALSPNLKDAYFNEFKNLYRKSYSIMEYMSVIEDFNNEELKLDELKKILPNVDTYLRRILCNHFFYMKFPYTDFILKKEEAAIVLEVLILFWINILYYQKNDMNIDKFVDVSGRFFRVIEHTNFYKNVLVIYDRYCTTD